MVSQTAMHSQQSISLTERWKRRAAFLLPILSLVVVLAVFWWLKLVGVTMAGEAFCGMEEHTHSYACILPSEVCTEEHGHTDSCTAGYACGLEEHTHVSTCYADLSADLETSADWEATLSEIPSGLTGGSRVAAVAQSQLGYTESTLNFTVDTELVRHGYTRYGAWYGNPYGDWSAMFTSFCLRYGGRESVPISGGAETLRLEWEKQNLYRALADYTPRGGDVVFLDKNGNGTADATAILISRAEGILTVVEGDLEHTVAQTEYAETDAALMGYGISFAEGSAVVTGNSHSIGETLPEGGTVIATATESNPDLFTKNNRFVIYSLEADGYYALDGDGVSVPVTVDEKGRVSCATKEISSLYWTITVAEDGSYLGTNSATGRVVSLAISEEGVISVLTEQEPVERMLSSRAFAAPSSSVSTPSSGYALAVAASYTVWLDGTNGGMMAYGGSPDEPVTVTGGDTLKLPSQWESPEKYSYTLRGWYDVINAKYYQAGSEITVNEDLVLYADWIAATYDVGVFNSDAVNSISTKSFISAYMFDYNDLFNVMSANPTVTFEEDGHSESWKTVTSSNKVSYGNTNSLDFFFMEHDSSGQISNPSGKANGNAYTTGVYQGIYNAALGEVLFGLDNSFDPATGTGIPGKTLLGEADYLFQIMDDPKDPHYGYYYYDSARNAASYNKSEGRFYVYNYLSRTRDSSSASGAGQYSDFLALNSPYVVPDGKTLPTYTYNGDSGEYEGVTHYQYDAKYSGSNNTTDYAIANFSYGMSFDLRFYLPDVPGEKKSDGTYGNLDVHGNQMLFEFSGDDDIWVLLDGEVVLDIGGIHQVKEGSINFSTGVIVVDGKTQDPLEGVAAGEHYLSVYYLERGASQSNCSIYFNISPRYWFDLQKEDVLTRDLLNGAEFTFFTDKECTQPAELWMSEEAYLNKEPARNTCTVVNGAAQIWGLSPGRAYYIRETKAPDKEEYSVAHGLIVLTLDDRGGSSAHVEVIGDPNDGENATPSMGFSAYGYTINDNTHHAYIVITNGQDWISETTTVQVQKKWDDTKDHSADSVIAYLTVVDSSGDVRRIREEVLSAENGWQCKWTSLPKYWSDGTEVVYGVAESYFPGYSSSYEQVDRIEVSTDSWESATSFTKNAVFLLKTSSGCLAAVSESDTTLEWVTEEEAKSSPLAQWTASATGSSAKLTNGAGQVLTFNYNSSSSRRYFYVTESSSDYQTIYISTSGSTLRLSAKRSSTNYYIGSISSGKPAAPTSSSSGLTFTLMQKTSSTEYRDVEGLAYQLTNTPLEEEASVVVRKEWDSGVSDPSVYETEQVLIRLYANGVDTGRTVTLNLQNGWTDTFRGLPYKDQNGTVILYTVREEETSDLWEPVYGEAVYTKATVGSYQITVFNRYLNGSGYELPATDGSGPMPYLLIGSGMILASLALAWVLRRKKHTAN